MSGIFSPQMIGNAVNFPALNICENSLVVATEIVGCFESLFRYGTGGDRNRGRQYPEVALH
jgi:hypothetical protein